MMKTYQWSHPGRESLELNLEVEGSIIQAVRLKASGCLAFLELSQNMKKKLKGSIEDLIPPSENDHCSMIWREVILTIQEKWNLPVTAEELCHCRKVTTQKVDHAVIYGAHSIDEIRHRTSANTGCGTCMQDVLSMISNRKKNL